MTAPILVITSGEPTGIGPNICLDLALADLFCCPVVLCDKNLLAQRAEQLGKSVILRDFQAQAAEPLPKGEPEVLRIPLDAEYQVGELNPINAAYVLRLLDTAYQGIPDGPFAGMVIVSLHKGIVNDAHAGNSFFSGHAEYLAEKSHIEQVVMMLTGGDLHVALVTAHLPLKDISAAITKPLIESVVRTLEHDLHHGFGITKPAILATGLNPHVDEDGHLEHERIDTIIPALHTLQAEGIDAHGPCLADTVFQPFLLKDANTVLTMYHDQGLPVLKYIGFDKGVDITLGLPFIRTSVDHGTTLNLAGTGKADSGSLVAAVLTALDMAHNMQKQAV